MIWENKWSAPQLLNRYRQPVGADPGYTSKQVYLLEVGTRSNNRGITWIAEITGENFDRTQNKVLKLITDKLEIDKAKVADTCRAHKWNVQHSETRHGVWKTFISWKNYLRFINL